MPRYVADPTKVSFAFVVFPKGSYRVEFGEPKSFAGKGKKGDNWGVRYNGKVVSSEEHPELVGKDFPQTLYFHTEGAEKYSKQVEAAVLGAADDEEFNTKFGGLDWSFNTDDGSAGQGFWELKGQVVDIECDDPTINEDNGNQQTNVKKYRTVR